MRSLNLLANISAFGFLVTNAMWSCASEQSTGKPKDLPAEDVYLNIQVLKGVPSSQIYPIMRLMSASLGVECSECHRPDDLEKDVKPSKQVARKMLQMVFEINRTNFKGRPLVTCNSCHRGQRQPIATPDVIQPVQKTISKTPKTPLPAIETIIEHYVSAVGGRSRFESFKGCVLKGLLISPNGSQPIEISQIEPGRMTITAPFQYGAPKTPDGKRFVVKLPNGLFRSEVGPSAMKQYEYLIHPIRFVEGHRDSRVIGKTKVGESEAYEVVASAEGFTARLFFDVRNGLLIRRVVAIKNTVLGPVLEQSDFEDYRDVDGVKLPFVMIASQLPGATTLKLVEIKHDTPSKAIDANAKIRR